MSRKKGKTRFPEKGDKVWRELTADEKERGLGANGVIVKIDWETDPKEYLVMFSKPTATGTASRETFNRDDLTWTDSYNGTWVKGELP